MNIERACELLDQIAALSAEARLELVPAVPPPPPPPPVYDTPAELDAAIAAAAPGDTLLLGNFLTYPVPLNITKSLTLRAETLLDGREDLSMSLPLFLDGITVTADNVTLIGLSVRKVNHLTDIVTVLGANVTLDRLRIFGDQLAGAKRGVAAHANGNLQILRCYIEDCFQSYPGNDSQAILAWDMLPGLLIEDCYLSGGSETVMVGGADSTSPARDPKDITVRHCTITKRPEWQAKLIGVKNTFELKNARNVLVEDCDISLSWGGHGQDGYAIALTVRNQSGTNPTSSIEDVIFRNNRIASAAGAVVILGKDNNAASGQLARVTFQANAFTDIRPSTYTGAVKIIQIGGGSVDLKFLSNTFAGAGSSSALYFYGTVLSNTNTGFTFTSNVVPPTNYGIFGEGSSPMNPTLTPGAASSIVRYTTGWVYSGNTVVA